MKATWPLSQLLTSACCNARHLQATQNTWTGVAVRQENLIYGHCLDFHFIFKCHEIAILPTIQTRENHPEFIVCTQTACGPRSALVCRWLILSHTLKETPATALCGGWGRQGAEVGGQPWVAVHQRGGGVMDWCGAGEMKRRQVRGVVQGRISETLQVASGG